MKVMMEELQASGLSAYYYTVAICIDTIVTKPLLLFKYYLGYESYDRRVASLYFISWSSCVQYSLTQLSRNLSKYLYNT